MCTPAWDYLRRFYESDANYRMTLKSGIKDRGKAKNKEERPVGS
jgi:hypothetical protein